MYVILKNGMMIEAAVLIELSNMTRTIEKHENSRNQ